jgi:hypothetical protein
MTLQVGEDRMAFEHAEGAAEECLCARVAVSFPCGMDSQTSQAQPGVHEL